MLNGEIVCGCGAAAVVAGVGIPDMWEALSGRTEGEHVRRQSCSGRQCRNDPRKCHGACVGDGGEVNGKCVGLGFGMGVGAVAGASVVDEGVGV